MITNINVYQMLFVYCYPLSLGKYAYETACKIECEKSGTDIPLWIRKIIIFR